ncbi:MAG: radical SAM protein [Bacteroidales bacterium]|nr:radical SAM protein [Bacteroidales bacterium]
MTLLQDYASPLSGLLKDQRLQEGESYRLMHFVVQLPVDEGLLLYNVMTRAVALLTPEEARRMQDDPLSVPELVAKWFAVPLIFDDRKLAREVRAVGRMLEKRPKGLTGFTILTTTDCNARCFYCYEKGRSRVSMKEDTALKVAEFIIRNHIDEKVKLLWFGGEPLYNKGVISLICDKLRHAGVEYQSSMVSNGYLFDDETVTEAIGPWNLKKVQITLDGTEKVYNRSKAFIYQEGSPYLRVLGNIHRLLDAGVKVSIRLNVGRHNADDLLDLADVLANEFGGYKLFGVYSHTLFEAGAETEAASHTAARRRELYEARLRLQEKLRDGRIASERKLPDQLRLNRCMADCDANVVILPDGHLGKCEHYSEDHWFGSVDSPEQDETLLAEFKRLREELDACADCPFYPDCYRLVLCEQTVHCYSEEREEKRLTTLRNLLDFYRMKENEVSD